MRGFGLVRMGLDEVNEMCTSVHTYLEVIKLIREHLHQQTVVS